jgi:hypothetical protein
VAETPTLGALAAALRGAGLSWDWLQGKTSGIVLFGSRAAGVSSAASDWDLLCLGARGSRPSGPIDLVWVDPDYLRSDRWLGSELASHVAAFGRPLTGSHAWISSVFVSPEAAARKARRVIGKLEGIEIVWSVLGSAQRAKHVRWLRLELQRWERLRSERPVPPTALLDQEWERLDGAHAEWYRHMAERLAIQPQRLAMLLV